MSGESGQLQRLTDEQVSARLATYNPHGALDRDLELFKERALGFVVDEVRAQFGPERAERYADIYSGRADAAWVQSIAEYGREIFRNHTSVPEYIADRVQIGNRVFSALTEHYENDARGLASCMAAYYRLDVIETDIILAQVALLEAIEAADVRGRESE